MTPPDGPSPSAGPSPSDGVYGPDAVTLTSYFGERQRAGGRFAADALLDLYERHQIAVSVLLRGAEGFGTRGGLRTDRTLTLSEDLPLTAVAVDRADRVEPLAAEAAALTGPGLVTLERARLLGPDAAPWPGDRAGEAKLTLYLGRRQRAGGVPAFAAVCDLLYRRGIAGAAALLGVDGTVHGRRERAAFFGRNAGTPMTVEAVGSAERLARVLPELYGLVPRPLLTLEQVRLCKRDGQLLAAPPVIAGTEPSGRARWQKLTVYTSEAALHNGQPVHRTIMRRLLASGISGATTQRGIWGFHGDHQPHGDRLFQLGRHVPVVTEVIDAPERIAAAFGIIDELTAERGLVTTETVTIHPPAHLPRPAR